MDLGFQFGKHFEKTVSGKFTVRKNPGDLGQMFSAYWPKNSLFDLRPQAPDAALMKPGQFVRHPRRQKIISVRTHIDIRFVPRQHTVRRINPQPDIHVMSDQLRQVMIQVLGQDLMRGNTRDRFTRRFDEQVDIMTAVAEILHQLRGIVFHSSDLGKKIYGNYSDFAAHARVLSSVRCAVFLAP